MENFIEYQYNSKDKENSIWYTNTNIYTETATGFGFNSKRLYAGISFNGYINVMRVLGVSIKTNFASASITIRYRFNSLRFFKRVWGKAAASVKDIVN